MSGEAPFTSINLLAYVASNVVADDMPIVPAKPPPDELEIDVVTKFLVATSCAFTGSATFMIVLELLSKPFLALNRTEFDIIPFPYAI